MKGYTVGFIFNTDLSKVVLVLKSHPDWQKGKLNGPGGKIEEGEDSCGCVVREILEETGLETKKDGWRYFAKINSEDWFVDFYSYVHTGSKEDVTSQTDEVVGWFDARPLPKQVVDNLNWLIPMGIDKIKNDDFYICKIEHK